MGELMTRRYLAWFLGIAAFMALVSALPTVGTWR